MRGWVFVAVAALAGCSDWTISEPVANPDDAETSASTGVDAITSDTTTIADDVEALTDVVDEDAGDDSAVRDAARDVDTATETTTAPAEVPFVAPPGCLPSDYAIDPAPPAWVEPDAGVDADAGSPWAAAPPLLGPRGGHLVLHLADGRLVVVGGSAGFAPTPTIESYDPATGTWSVYDTWFDTRWAPSAGVVLADGRALLLVALEHVLRARIYDPEFRAWSDAALPHSLAEGPNLTLLHDGRVLATGGSIYAPGGSGVTTSTDAAVYDPSLDRWTDLWPMRIARAGHAVFEMSGRVLAIGGPVAPESYDLATGLWQRLPDVVLTGAVWNKGMAVLLPDDTVLVSGSPPSPTVLHGEAPTPFARFDPRCGRWTAEPWLPFIVRGATPLALPTGDVVLVGGGGNGYGKYDHQPPKRTPIFHPSTSAWTLLPAWPSVEGGPGSITRLADSDWLLAGGYSCGGGCVPTGRVLRFSPP